MQQLSCLSYAKTFGVFLSIVLAMHFLSAAHYVVGIVNDALDGTYANGYSVVLWNPANGIADNLTDTIGPSGNSRTSNFYLIDCEMLDDPCTIGDVLNISILSFPFSNNNATVTITGAGFDIASNMTLNSPPNFLFMAVDDMYGVPFFPENEIDLVAASTQNVFCEAIVEEYDGDSLENVVAEFFDNSVSFFGDSDDNNTHYSNSTCFLNASYGTINQTKITCGFEVLYNANATQWNCTMTLEDNLSTGATGSDWTYINPLLSIGVFDYVDFGGVAGDSVSTEAIVNVTNFGNVKINLSFYGYGNSEGDGYAMVCDSGNIPIGYKKYNLTSSTAGSLSLGEFEQTYYNLTATPVIRNFNLDYRRDEGINEATNNTYWRIYVPNSVGGQCSGSIVFGAVQGGE